MRCVNTKRNIDVSRDFISSDPFTVTIMDRCIHSQPAFLTVTNCKTRYFEIVVIDKTNNGAPIKTIICSRGRPAQPNNRRPFQSRYSYSQSELRRVGEKDQGGLKMTGNRTRRQQPPTSILLFVISKHTQLSQREATLRRATTFLLLSPQSRSSDEVSHQ